MTPKEAEDFIRFRKGSPIAVDADGDANGGMSSPLSTSTTSTTSSTTSLPTTANRHIGEAAVQQPIVSARWVVLQNLHCLPWLGLSVGTVSIVTPYLVAVYKGDVPAWLPFISDAGGDPPQSAIFSMGMTLVGLMFCIGIYLCYLILEAQNVKDCKLVTSLGKVLVVTGFLMSIGLFGVATNPTGHLRRDGGWATVVLIPHMIGAVLFFVSGIAMMVILTFTTYLIQKPNWLNLIFITRFVVMAGSLLGGFLVLVALPPIPMFEQMKPSPDHGRIYPPGVEVSAFGEWLIVIMFMCFVATFIPAFGRTKVTLVVDYQ